MENRSRSKLSSGTTGGNDPNQFLLVAPILLKNIAGLIQSKFRCFFMRFCEDYGMFFLAGRGCSLRFVDLIVVTFLFGRIIG